MFKVGQEVWFEPSDPRDKGFNCTIEKVGRLYYTVGIITNQRSEIEKLRGLLKECLRYIDIWGYTDSHENLLYPQIKVALGESEEK